MASTRTPSAQTLREIREIGLPLEAVNKERAALKLQVGRLRGDLIKIADDREVGRYRGAMRRLIIASEGKAVLPTEAMWLKECEELSGSFDFSHEAGQLRASHMIEFAQQEGLLLLDGKDDIDWFLQGWEARINKRLQRTDERVILGLGTTKSMKVGVTPTIYFTVVSVEEYDAWIEANEADA